MFRFFDACCKCVKLTHAGAFRASGFVFHRFSSLQGRCLKPLAVSGNPYAMLSQTLWGDAVYVRDTFELRGYSQEQLLRAALVLHEIYHSYDLVAHMLKAYDERAVRPTCALSP